MARYVVLEPTRVRGIYDTWPECQAAVTGVRGAVYREAVDRALAEQLLTGNGRRLSLVRMRSSTGTPPAESAWRWTTVDPTARRSPRRSPRPSPRCGPTSGLKSPGSAIRSRKSPPYVLARRGPPGNVSHHCSRLPGDQVPHQWRMDRARRGDAGDRGSLQDGHV